MAFVLRLRIYIPLELEAKTLGFAVFIEQENMGRGRGKPLSFLGS